jgi:hypothetical protein
MRAILAFAILLLGLSAFAREPEYSVFFADYFRGVGGNAVSALVEIESSIGRGDRLLVLRRTESVVEVDEADDEAEDAMDDSAPPTVSLASLDFDAGFHRAASAADIEADQLSDNPMEVLCTALSSSAQNNGLPVPFLANLIWQESRFQNDTVSRAGAMGIAQFMPERAAESGLKDPFDPMQAIPASARLLADLRQEFGNLGFAAAAYNAGPRRVTQWLDHGRTLPRETRDYVIKVTGRTAETWRKTPAEDAELQFVRHLPCRGLAAFAEVEQGQVDQGQAQRTDAEPAKQEPTQAAQHAEAESHKGYWRAWYHRHHPRLHIRPGMVRNHRGSRHEAWQSLHRRSA